MGYAALPMYDWPEVRGATDALWAALGGALREAGVAAPDILDRATHWQAGWLHPDLILSQTCGLPYVRHLRGRVRMVGSPVYALPDMAPGDYCSRIVVRRADPAALLADLRGRRAAINEAGSQSGAAALRHAVASPGFFGSVIETGTHRASLRAVAEGAADVAAIDAVSWALARDHDPAADRLRVLASTPPTPGLPMITGLAQDADRVAVAVRTGIAALDPRSARALHLTGFRAREDADYEIIAERDRSAPVLA